MNEGEFNSNFTWFEWSFVSPEQFATEESPAPVEQVTSPFTFEQRAEVWDDDNRWTT